jgi:tRNA (guanine-N7-)-methyltransferase
MIGTGLARQPNFYGRRYGRKLRPGQQRLYAELLPRLAIDPAPVGGPLDPVALFDPPRKEVWLEIGFGGGEHLAEQARAHPEVGIIGCEVFVNGIASLLGHIDRLALENVRIYPDDARPLLDRLPDAGIARAFLLFPDPWPKARHERRRFIGRENLDRLARLLADGAELRVASDDPTYIRWVLEQILPHPAFQWLARRPGDWRERPADWPPTRYEQKALREGRTPVFFRFVRRPRTSSVDGS